MQNEDNFTKLRFAVQFFKNGKNAAATARSFNKTRQWAHNLKNDPTVKEYMSELEQLIGLDKLSKPDTEKLENDIADINEILTILTAIARGEREEDTVVVIKEETVEWDGKQKNVTKTESPKVVKTTTKNADIVRASSELLKYLTTNAADADQAETGIVLIPEIKET